jgi:hypothetical protein
MRLDRAQQSGCVTSSPLPTTDSIPVARPRPSSEYYTGPKIPLRLDQNPAGSYLSDLLLGGVNIKDLYRAAPQPTNRPPVKRNLRRGTLES